MSDTIDSSVPTRNDQRHATSDSGRPDPLRLASWNIFSGKVFGGRFDMAKLRTSLHSLDVDVLAMQEVDNGMFRSKRANLAQVAGECLGGEHYFAHIRRRFDLGRYGNAWATRSGELRNVANLGLYRKRFWNEKRKVTFATLDRGGASWRLANTHLALFRHESERQLRQILELMPKEGPAVVMGDFNRRPDEVESIAAAYGFAAVETGPTYSSRDPQLRIDWILVRNAKVISADVRQLQVSDHCAVVAELEAD